MEPTGDGGGLMLSAVISRVSILCGILSARCRPCRCCRCSRRRFWASLERLRRL